MVNLVSRLRERRRRKNVIFLLVWDRNFPCVYFSLLVELSLHNLLCINRSTKPFFLDKVFFCIIWQNEFMFFWRGGGGFLLK